MWGSKQRDDQAAIEAASRPRSCPDCGRLFIGSAAFTVHKDPTEGCLGDGARGQLELIDGAWRMPGSDTAGR
jgi:hypothetical protein